MLFSLFCYPCIILLFSTTFLTWGHPERGKVHRVWVISLWKACVLRMRIDQQKDRLDFYGYYIKLIMTHLITCCWFLSDILFLLIVLIWNHWCSEGSPSCGFVCSVTEGFLFRSHDALCYCGWFSGTVIHSWVFRLHILSNQSHGPVGGVYVDTKLVL